MKIKYGKEYLKSATFATRLASNEEIPYKIVERRPGDIAACYADPSKARDELGWVAERGIEEMCRDAWRFIKK